MAKTYSRETDGKLGNGAGGQIQGNSYQAKLKRIRATVLFTGQAAADTIVLGELPAGAIFAYGVLTASATLGASATIAIGKAGTPAKYKAAAVFTAADTPTLFGKASAADDEPLTAIEEVIMTIGTAALPTSSDYVIVDLYYSDLA